MNPLHTAQGVPFLRTPRENFDGLADFAYPASHIEFEGLRLAYVEAGSRDGPLALLMHGMPTWSYLNRKIIAGLCAAGWRCIALDHIGFGRSDKVTDPDWYSILRHVAACRALIEALDLRDITLFCQDWGGPIGLAQAAEMPDRFGRLVIMNTWLHHEGYSYTEALRRWNTQWKAGGLFAEKTPEPLSIGWFMTLATRRIAREQLFAIAGGGVKPTLSPQDETVRRGYDAPFAGLGAAALAGVRRFPLSLPFDNPLGGAAAEQDRWHARILSWPGPVNFVWGGQDDVFTEAWGRSWAARLPQSTFDLLPDAGHFLQDTHGDEIAQIVLTRTRI